METDKQLAIVESRKSYLKSLKDIHEPEQVDSFIKGLTLSPRAIILSRDEVPSISVICKEENEFYLMSVEMMLAKLMVSLNVKENINDVQIEIIPPLLVEKYPYFKLNDVWNICKNIMIGKYKIYERMDVETFFRCVMEYDGSEERSAALEEVNKRNQQTEKDAIEALSGIPKEIRSEFKKIGKGHTLKDAKISMARAMERLKQEKGE